MIGVDARVEDLHDDVRRAGRVVPRTKKVGDVVVVLRVEHGVVRRRGEEADLEFRLGGGHGRAERVVVRRQRGHLLEGRDGRGAALALALVPHVEAVRLVLLLVRLARSEQTVRVLTRDAVGNFPGNGRGAVGRGRDRAAVQLVAQALVDRVGLALEIVDGGVELVVHRRRHGRRASEQGQCKKDAPRGSCSVCSGFSMVCSHFW
mmetsp:Transcript_182/g.662  ORF Transcript_182/g.662 Transcript_182/m.662 type:complete len:205 (+) Transcript_182:2917-3531(+)